jgi:hypothetical protein
VGNRIRILAVPALDMRAMAEAMRRKDPLAQWTTRVLQRLADRRHVVRIDEIDDHGTPWFPYSFKNKSNEWEHHHLAVMEDDSWELVDSDLLRTGTSP